MEIGKGGVVKSLELGDEASPESLAFASEARYSAVGLLNCLLSWPELV